MPYRRPPSDPDPGELEVAPWPAWVRYGILSVIAVVVGIGLIIALYRYGWLSVTGPFVVLLLVPLVFFARALWIRRRLLRSSAAALAALRSTATAIESERRQAAGARPSTATDQSLDDAADCIESALKHLAWGQEAAASAAGTELARVASAWKPQSDLAHSAGASVQALAQLGGIIRRADDLIRRRDGR